MKGYNKFMETFWLIVTILIIISVTILSFKDGFRNWAMYYVVALMTFGTFSLRRWMRKRMEKHQAYLHQQANSEDRVSSNH